MLGDGGGIMFSCVIKHCSVISYVSSARGNAVGLHLKTVPVQLVAWPHSPDGAFSNKIPGFKYSFWSCLHVGENDWNLSRATAVHSLQSWCFTQFTVVTLYRVSGRDVSLQYDRDVLHSLQSWWFTQFTIVYYTVYDRYVLQFTSVTFYNLQYRYVLHSLQPWCFKLWWCPC